MKKLFCFGLQIVMSMTVLAQRMEYPLNDAWRFFKGQCGVVASTTDWQEVTLPHSWNVEVDNTHRQDIPLLSGDFNVNGRLYRLTYRKVLDI